MSPIAPPARVLTAFRITETPLHLAGGQGVAFRAGAIVLKPGNDPVAAKWEAETLSGVRQEGFRLAAQVRSSAGEWCVEGWCAWEFLEGKPELGRWGGRVKVIREFHRALIGLSKPSHLDSATHPWAVADRIAWGEAKAELASPFREHVDRLFAILRPVDLPNQVIHGDMAWENVLFHESLPPAVIDISPNWRPADFALAIAANDAMAWEGEDASILEAVDDARDFYQLLTRATIWRLLVAEQAYRGGWREAITDLEAHHPVVEICLARAGGGR